MRGERDIQGPESLEPNYDLREIIPGACGFKLTRRDFLKVTLIGALVVTANKACNTFDIGIPTPEGTKITPTETVPLNNFPIATDTTEVSSYGQYEFIEQSEIEANLKEPYEHFKNNPDVKALFNDPGTIEYSAMGIKVYLQGGGHTNYIFFEASSETEEKGYIAMVLGGKQPGEISYSVLNRIVDSNGMVGLGLTSDIGGNRLENPVMIFNTGLTEKEISQLTADDLLKRDLLFIPGGIKVPSERIIGAKALFSPIPIEPTPTPEAPEQVFVPEGFAIAEGGLLRNPETGRNVLAMNPEADWKRVREGIIGGLWQANIDWYKFTGEGSDALNYSKEAFIKAALEGKTFKLGIPVRLNAENIPEDFERGRDRFVVFKMVDIVLDNIQIQILSPDAFAKYTGRSWLETGQEAYDCASYPGTGSNVILFTTDTGRLMISVGSFYFRTQLIESLQGLMGNFNPELYEKYPSYFRPDGIGIEADKALSFTLGYALDELDFFPLAHYKFTGVNGEKIKIISIGKTMGYPDEESYLNPQLFIFNK